MKTYFLNILFICTLFPCVDQDREIGIQGIVVSEKNTPVADVMITVNWRKIGFLSHEDGSFYIMANTQDTLVFRHTSFEPKAIALQNLNADTLKVQLQERTLILDEVEVLNLGEWQDFKHKVANMNSDSIRNTNEYRLETMFGDKKRHPIKNPYYRGQKEPKINPLTILGGLISENLPQILYNKYSKEEKNRRKIQAEKIQELTVENNAFRYSEKKLGELLNLQGDSLKNFKIYCDYALDFSQNDFELTKQINDLYAKWKVQKSDSLKKKNYLPVSDIKTPFNSSMSEQKQ